MWLPKITVQDCTSTYRTIFIPHSERIGCSVVPKSLQDRHVRIPKCTGLRVLWSVKTLGEVLFALQRERRTAQGPVLVRVCVAFFNNNAPGGHCYFIVIVISIVIRIAVLFLLLVFLFYP